MGTMRHHAIIVTSWSRDVLEAAANKAKELGLEVVGPSAVVTNGISTFLVCPDGSNEGWSESDEFDRKREQFLDLLRATKHDDGSGPLRWACVQYSSDDQDASVTEHAWGPGQGLGHRQIWGIDPNVIDAEESSQRPALGIAQRKLSRPS